MSTEFQAVLVVGVPYDRVVKRTTVAKKVIKYNPDTGAKYETDVSEEVVKICGKKVDPDAEENQDTFDFDAEGNGVEYEFALLKKFKLAVVTAGYENDDEANKIIGVTVSTVEQGENPLSKVTLVKLAAARDAVDHTLREGLGYEGPAPEPYLILTAG